MVYFGKLEKAKEETEIANYYEKIEIIRTELKLQNENYESPSLIQMQEEFEQNQTDWVASTDIRIIEEVEKLELITKDEYIFHITETKTEYKGNGKVIDTSALEKEDALRLEVVGENTNKGRWVKITDLSEKDYYKIEYQINSTEREWNTIESGKTVEVAYSSTIHARLVLGSNKGIVISLSIEASNPKVEEKKIDTSSIARKTTTPLVELFNIT